MIRETLNQEQLLHPITSQIRQLLKLPEILTTTAQEIRFFLTPIGARSTDLSQMAAGK